MCTRKETLLSTDSPNVASVESKKIFFIDRL